MPRDESRSPRADIIAERRDTLAEVRQELVASGSISRASMPIADAVNLQVLDASGNPAERHTFMLGIDTLGSIDARLQVLGRTYNWTS